MKRKHLKKAIELVGKGELAKAIGVNPKTLYRWSKGGVIRAGTRMAVLNALVDFGNGVEGLIQDIIES